MIIGTKSDLLLIGPLGKISLKFDKNKTIFIKKTNLKMCLKWRLDLLNKNNNLKIEN